MFNHDDYHMVKAQQERMLAQVPRRRHRTRLPNPVTLLFRWLGNRNKRQTEPQLSGKRAAA